MDPDSLAKFEKSRESSPSQVQASSADPPGRSPLWNLDDKKVYMVIRSMGGTDIGAVVGRFEPQNDVTTEFGREMKNRLLKREYSRQPGEKWRVDPSPGYTEDIIVGDSKIYPIEIGVIGGRRRKTRRRMIKKRRRTRSKRPSKA